MRVAIFGAGGKVARSAIQHLVFNNEHDDWELVLIARNTRRVEGLLLDIESARPLLEKQTGRRTTSVDVHVTSDLAATSGADLIAIAAGVWPSVELAVEFKRRDASGRLVQSYANFGLVRDVCAAIAARCPNARVLMVTNQSDLMSELARTRVAPERVLGMGGMLDSARLRQLAAALLSLPLAEFVNGPHMVGFHNDRMQALASTLPMPIAPQDLARLVRKTREYGAAVTELQRDLRLPLVNSGSSILAGFALYLTISAYLGHTAPLHESFNALLPADVAGHYGTLPGRALSVPVRWERGAVTFAALPAVTSEEQVQLRDAQHALHQEFAILSSVFERQ